MTATASAERPARRNAGDVEAMAAAYRAGQVFLGKLSMPVIDFRHYLEADLDMHHSLQSFTARLRMLREQGHADNQLIWVAMHPYAPLGDAFDVLEQWLANIHADAKLSIAEARPPDATDRCYGDSGEIFASGNAVWDGVWNGKRDGACMVQYPIYSNPRIEAGDDYVGDILKCHLQSVDDAIAGDMYAPVDVSSHRDELHRVFPTGVCDYSRGDAAKPAGVILN